MEQLNIEEMQRHLSEMSSMDINDIDPEGLTEIKDLKIDHKLTVPERVLSVIKQTGNPYAYLDNGTIVKISFADSGKTLQSCMEDYLVSEILPDVK